MDRRSRQARKQSKWKRPQQDLPRPLRNSPEMARWAAADLPTYSTPVCGRSHSTQHTHSRSRPRWLRRTAQPSTNVACGPGIDEPVAWQHSRIVTAAHAPSVSKLSQPTAPGARDTRHPPEILSECGGNDTICSRRSESPRCSRREMKLLPLGDRPRCTGRRARSPPRPSPC